MRDYLAEIAATLNEEVFQRIQLTRPTVFLVGAGPSTPSSLRDQIRDELAGRPRIPGFDVYYPEELFEELLRGAEPRADLLELENLLAENVHAVVIVLESEGPIAELGAFANHEKLRDRLVVIVNKRYRKARSFIMLGPIKYLRQKTRSRIVYYEPMDIDLDKLGKNIRAGVRKVSAGVTVETSVRNPVLAQHYLRAAIDVLHPIQRTTLQSLIQSVAPINATETNRIVIAALSILTREKEVALGNDGYTLTKAGRDRLGRMLKLEEHGRQISTSLDRTRINVMTWKLRRKRALRT